MKRYDLLTPEGTRDLLYDECAALRVAEDKLRRIFLSRGYTEIVTPGLEFYDVFNSKSRRFLQEQMYKLTDAKGRLMVLRPDSTMPIARVVGTRLREKTFPLKLFYSQTIYRVNPKESGRDDEFSQSGIEIIGGDGRRADLEALSMAIEVMESLEADDFRFEIGDSSFFTLLSARLDLSEEETDELRALVQTKNYPELSSALADRADDPYARALCELPRLFGGEEVFARAEAVLPDGDAREVLARLKALYKNLLALGVKDRIAVDLGLISKNEDYYTGVVFRGYAEGYGMPVLTGGRYDRLLADFGVDTPATGFAVNVNAAAKIVMEKAKKPLAHIPDVLVYAEEDAVAAGLNRCRALIAEGKSVDFADVRSAEEARAYAKERGIARLDTVTADGRIESERVEDLS
ncbi:MAG: ATP phosphoribosyltransferase regulatory subunit [Bacteroides sp.]|nr:ATP phosphoribosyltransferase regulatory subunit [Eubacterium sp.]MCM1418711.1 ATP phosphoribosyltransferase regulatory subunit [Roseburia sp.]MCM1462739.1 ATP phosphoribosyltransferase regulatory subunit [Bacteroides sp.]